MFLNGFSQLGNDISDFKWACLDIIDFGSNLYNNIGKNHMIWKLYGQTFTVHDQKCVTTVSNVGIIIGKVVKQCKKWNGPKIWDSQK